MGITLGPIWIAERGMLHLKQIIKLIEFQRIVESKMKLNEKHVLLAFHTHRAEFHYNVTIDLQCT